MLKYSVFTALLAAFSLVHCYNLDITVPPQHNNVNQQTANGAPNPSGFVDEQERIINEIWNGLKSRYKKQYCAVTQEMNKQISRFIHEFCGVQENMDECECDDGRAIKRYNLIEAIKSQHEFASIAWSHEPTTRQDAYNRIKTVYCNEIIEAGRLDDDEDEDRIDWKKLFGRIVKGAVNLAKRLGPKLKTLMKTGANYIKKSGVKITPLECAGNHCKSCISLSFVDQSACVQLALQQEAQATYLIVAIAVNDDPKLKEKLRLGNVPRCVKLGGIIGNICLKGLEGKAKSNQGNADVNFCLVVLCERYAIGAKFCASYADNKMKIAFKPELFAGGISDSDGEILKLQGNEETGEQVDATEFH